MKSTQTISPIADGSISVLNTISQRIGGTVRDKKQEDACAFGSLAQAALEAQIIQAETIAKRNSR